MKIANKQIGDGNPVFIIAEAGSNHEQSLEQAKKLIDVAVHAGADAVKFQLLPANIYRKGTEAYRIAKALEMPYEWIPELVRYCKKKIIFFATVFNKKGADALEKHVDLYKIASPEIVKHNLIKYTAKKMKPIIISTGMSNIPEVSEAINDCRKTGNNKIALMHCVTAYPAKPTSYNLHSINLLKDIFNIPVGLSDHTTDPTFIPSLAVASGANLIEKHFRLNKEYSISPDHNFSIGPGALKLMVEKIRETEKIMGKIHKQIAKEEMPNLKYRERG